MTVQNLFRIWGNAYVPTIRIDNAISKLDKLIKKYKDLQKHMKRRSSPQMDKETKFQVCATELFDVAPKNAMEIMKNEEDHRFLIDQRGPRDMIMGSVDKNLCDKETKKNKRKINSDNRAAKEMKRANASSGLLELVGSSGCESSCSSCDSDFVSEEPGSNIGPSGILSKEVTSALDRCNTSDRNAYFTLCATAKSMGHNIAKLPLSRSSIRRYRIGNREDIAQNIKSDFRPTVPLVVHWDGKLMKDTTAAGASSKVDRLPVIVTGYEVDKLLAIPKLVNGTGKIMANAVHECVKEWDLDQNIKAMCFDTTSSNTGVKSGACVLLEINMGKQLLHLACRHHIHEILLSDVFRACFGSSSGPDVLLFKRFQENWPYIDKTKFIPVKSGLLDGELIQELKETAVAFSFSTLSSTSQPRDDYREFLELALIFLGETPTRGVHIMAPGAFHHARWMSKILYILKIYLFKGQFKLTKHEERNLLEFGKFATLVYLKPWYLSPIPQEAAVNDLLLMENLVKYQTVNPPIATAASKAIKRHLWYLSEELVGFSLFSDDIASETKEKIVEAFSNTPAPTRTVRVDATTLTDLHLESFVTSRSLVSLHLFGIDEDFLQVNPSQWGSSSSYASSKTIISSIKVVNDSAERNVALATTYNDTITKNEEQKQFLLQTVEDHRKRFKTAKKHDMMHMHN